MEKPVMGQFVNGCRQKTCKIRFKCGFYYKSGARGNQKTPKHKVEISGYSGKPWLRVVCKEKDNGIMELD